MKSLVISVDFDGTCVTHEYPAIGKDIGAQRVLNQLVDKGHRIILFTMRSGIELEEAKLWFARNDIPLFGVNENPEQHTWTTSPKPFSHFYIDDMALGCPLKSDGKSRMFVNWDRIEQMLIDGGVL